MLYLFLAWAKWAVMLLLLFALLTICICRIQDKVAVKKRRQKRICKQKVNEQQLKILFLHPDLGIGGAERLIIDAAVGLQEKSHEVSIVTSFHDPERAFRETSDGTLHIKVRGSALPRHIAGGGLVLFATLRMWLSVVNTCLLGDIPDVWIVDQVAAAMPLLQLLSASPIFFYCHFPDQLCDPNRTKTAQQPKRFPVKVLHSLYRLAFDKFEYWCMLSADKVVCNSRFTEGVTRKTFPKIQIHGVLYPPINLKTLLAPISEEEDKQDAQLHDVRARLKERPVAVASINRFERKKNIALAIEAFAFSFHAAPKSLRDRMLLIVAGGYDSRLPENVECFCELNSLAFGDRCKLPAEAVLFLRSFSNAVKQEIFRQSHAIMYTPSNEHFGIVPVEAMAFGQVVIAVNNGGPTESVTLSESPRYGFLCEPTADAFSDALCQVLGISVSSTVSTTDERSALLLSKKSGENITDADVSATFSPDSLSSRAAVLRKEISKAAAERVRGLFSLEIFIENLNEALHSML